MVLVIPNTNLHPSSTNFGTLTGRKAEGRKHVSRRRDEKIKFGWKVLILTLFSNAVVRSEIMRSFKH